MLNEEPLVWTSQYAKMSSELYTDSRQGEHTTTGRGVPHTLLHGSDTIRWFAASVREIAMPVYDGSAELMALNGERISRVLAHLESQLPSGPKFGSWQGKLSPPDGGEFDGPIDLAEVIVRLPGGRTARAVLRGKTAEPHPALELVGSGPPPF